MSTKSEPQNLLSLIEVGDRLSLSGKQVLKLVKSGVLPSYNFLGCIRVDAEDLAAFIEQSRTGAASYRFVGGSFQRVSLGINLL